MVIISPDQSQKSCFPKRKGIKLIFAVSLSSHGQQEDYYKILLLQITSYSFTYIRTSKISGKAISRSAECSLPGHIDIGLPATSAGNARLHLHSSRMVLIRLLVS